MLKDSFGKYESNKLSLSKRRQGHEFHLYDRLVYRNEKFHLLFQHPILYILAQ